MKLTTTTALAGVLVSAGLGAARADDTPPPASTPNTEEAAAPASGQSDSLVLPKGKLEINAEVGIDLTKSLAGKPVSLSPDIWYGVTDDLTLGLVHTYEGTAGFMGGFGTSLCLTGTNDGCARIYNNVGLDARYRLMKPLSLDVGVYVPNIKDDFQLAIKVGISGRWHWNKLSLEAQPNLFIGLVGRPDDDTTGAAPTGPVVVSLNGNNTEQLNVPVTIGYDVAPKFNISLQTGLAMSFDHPGDNWRIPVSLGLRYAVTPKFGAGISFSFLDLIGGGDDTGADFRSLVIGGSYAL